METNSDPAVDAELEKMLANPDAFMAQISSSMTSFTIVGMIISLLAYFLVGFFVGRGVGAMRSYRHHLCCSFDHQFADVPANDQHVRELLGHHDGQRGIHPQCAARYRGRSFCLVA